VPRAYAGLDALRCIDAFSITSGSWSYRHLHRSHLWVEVPLNKSVNQAGRDVRVTVVLILYTIS